MAFVFAEGCRAGMSGEITALRVQQRNKERVNVELDGSYAFSVTLLEAARLQVGQRLTPEEIAALQARDEVERAYDRALRFLGYRPRSEAEVVRYLAKKEIAAPVQDEVLARLWRLQLIDDEAFARFWVESRERSRPSGRIALSVELRQKGVEDAIIEHVLEDLDQEKSAYRAIEKHARRYYGLTRKQAEQKAGAFLVRRGFPYSVAKATVKRLVSELAAEGKLEEEREELV
jgi:regulatory protein